MGEFLPLLVVIVVGLISTFSRMKGQNQENPRKPTVPPHLDPMHPRHFEGKMAQSQRTPTESMTQPSSKPIIKNETTWSNDRSSDLSRNISRTVVEKAEETALDTSHYVKNMNKKNLIQGLIMAEVLGPPRALKPHRTNLSQKLPK